MNGYWNFAEQKVEEQKRRKLQIDSCGICGPTLLLLGSVSLSPPPQLLSTFYSNWEQNIWTQHCFTACSCIPSPLPPFSLLSSHQPFGTWWKQRVIKGERVGWHCPQGIHRATSVRVSVQCSVCLQRHDNLTLPMLIALETLGCTLSFPSWKMFRTLNGRFKFRFPTKDTFP